MSVARSFISGNRCAVDKTMEETSMRNAKSRSGSGSGSCITGIAGNYDAYQRSVRTTHERSKYVELTLFMADMLTYADSCTWLRDLRPAEIQKSEERVSETIDAIIGFMDPSCIDDKDVYTAYHLVFGFRPKMNLTFSMPKIVGRGSEILS